MEAEHRKAVVVPDAIDHRRSMLFRNPAQRRARLVTEQHIVANRPRRGNRWCSVSSDNQRLAFDAAGMASNAMPSPRMKKSTIGSLANRGQ